MTGETRQTGEKEEIGYVPKRLQIYPNGVVKRIIERINGQRRNSKVFHAGHSWLT